mgnify:CR=1 FL=1
MIMEQLMLDKTSEKEVLSRKLLRTMMNTTKENPKLTVHMLHYYMHSLLVEVVWKALFL